MIKQTTSIPDEDEYVIRFHAEWCGPCKAFAPVYEDADFESDLTFYDVDVDKAPELADQFGVMSIPAVFHIRPDGVSKLKVTNNTEALLEQI